MKHLISLVAVLSLLITSCIDTDSGELIKPVTSEDLSASEERILSKVGTPTKLAYFLSYNGTPSHLTNPIIDFASTNTSGSIEYWIRTTNVAANSVFGTADNASSTRYFWTGPHNTGVLRIAQRNADTEDRLIGSTNLTDGIWHHVVINSDSFDYSVYIDSNLETLSIVTGSNTGDWFSDTSNRDNITVGALTMTTTSVYFIGDIGRIRIYSQPLTEDEIAENYRAGRNGETSNEDYLIFNLLSDEGINNPVDRIGKLLMTRTGAVLPTWNIGGY